MGKMRLPFIDSDLYIEVLFKADLTVYFFHNLHILTNVVTTYEILFCYKTQKSLPRFKQDIPLIFK